MEGRPMPWDGVIPDEDLASFAREFDQAERPLVAGTRPAVVVVDMTREFVDSTYPSGWSDTGWPAVKATGQLLDAARSAGHPVFFTRAYSDPNYRPTAVERGRWKYRSERERLPEGTPPGDVIVDDLAPTSTEVVVTKGSKPSAFFGTPLAAHLVHLGCDTVIVTGMTTSGCVRATVLDAFQHNFHVLVPDECCADRCQISHKVSLFDMHMKYADVISLSTTIEYLNGVTSGSDPARLRGA